MEGDEEALVEKWSGPNQHSKGIDDAGEAVPGLDRQITKLPHVFDIYPYINWHIYQLDSMAPQLDRLCSPVHWPSIPP